jgi:2-polyprenyl-3-methyl-5-hydroxy-6-metoxy-1,4-benzoquinol methylase
MEASVDKAGEKYWSSVWSNMVLQEAINIDSKHLKDHLIIQFHHVFKEFFNNQETIGKKFLEVGCGNSVWLPYFAKHYGFQISGLDYSEMGCIQSREILKRDGVDGGIVCGDMFNPPSQLIGNFDFVISMGVVEHFTNTESTIASLTKFLKPNGILITTIPNITGITGLLQKLINKPVYDIHIPLSKVKLIKAMENNLSILYSAYIGSVSLSVNLDEKDKPVKFLFFKKVIAKVLIWITVFIWQFEKLIFQLPKNGYFSPAIIVIGKRK